MRHLKQSVKLFKNMTKLYINPCTEMETNVRIDRKTAEDSTSDYLKLNFKFSSNRYLEILNKEAFGEETLLAQAGGYIGNLINPV